MKDRPVAGNEIRSLKSMRVLFADDDVQTADSMASILKIFFSEVVLAYDGVQALQLFEKKAPHVVLLDISMPLMNGLEVARQIRERDADIPIGILTNYDSREELKAAVPLGLVDYLLKPVDASNLRSLLRRCSEQLMLRGRLQYTFRSGVIYYPSTENVFGPDGEVTLSKNEKKFLRYMLDRRGQVVESQQICSHLIGENFETMSVQGLRNLVHRLRQKIGKNAIISKKELGYQLL